LEKRKSQDTPESKKKSRAHKVEKDGEASAVRGPNKRLQEKLQGTGEKTKDRGRWPFRLHTIKTVPKKGGEFRELGVIGEKRQPQRQQKGRN